MYHPPCFPIQHPDTFLSTNPYICICILKETANIPITTTIHYNRLKSFALVIVKVYPRQKRSKPDIPPAIFHHCLYRIMGKGTPLLIVYPDALSVLKNIDTA